MNKRELLAAIGNSGSAEPPDIEVDGLLGKLRDLEDRGRYARLLANIASANDKSNFCAAIFEATFAFQFEDAGLPLDYEVKQDEESNTSIDFLRQTESGISIYFEARLLQQDKRTEEAIERQLQETRFYRIAMNGESEHDAIVRLQNVIRSKVQKTDGTPIKFLRISNDIVNIVVVDVSDLLLSTIDLYDCLLSTHGDPYVDEEYRRGIFGLFQEPSSGYPERINAITSCYEHIRGTLSGVLFLFKARNSGLFDYNLEHYMIWNPKLTNPAHVEEICREIKSAIPVKQDRTQAERHTLQ